MMKYLNKLRYVNDIVLISQDKSILITIMTELPQYGSKENRTKHELLKNKNNKYRIRRIRTSNNLLGFTKETKR